MRDKTKAKLIAGVATLLMVVAALFWAKPSPPFGEAPCNTTSTVSIFNATTSQNENREVIENPCPAASIYPRETGREREKQEDIVSRTISGSYQNRIAAKNVDVQILEVNAIDY